MDRSAAFNRLLGSTPVLPVLTVPDGSDVVGLARALVAGGLQLLEITLRTETALKTVERVAREVPDAIVGAGTVRNGAQLRSAIDAGARFLVSPGSTDELMTAAVAVSVPWVPGCATASEAMRLQEAGWTFVKLFPAEAAGGVAFLQSLSAPLPELRFCPTGGVNAANAPSYLGLSNVGCVGGSWVAPKRLTEAGDWRAIEQLAREASALRP